MANKHRYRPYLLKFWKREIGSLWLPFEREGIKVYSQVKVNEKLTIGGYVKWISSRIFALIPTPFSNQIHLLCLNNTDRRPRDNSYITVTGTVELAKIRRTLGTPKRSRIFEGEKIINVDDWFASKLDIGIPKIDFEYSDFRNELTYRISDLEPKQVDFLSFTALSTPSFYENVGGVNLTLYDSTTRGLSHKVLREMRRIIPPDIGKLYSVNTPFGHFNLRYKYAHITADADKPLSKLNESFLINRTRKAIIEYDELSLSLYSAQKSPEPLRILPVA